MITYTNTAKDIAEVFEYAKGLADDDTTGLEIAASEATRLWNVIMDSTAADLREESKEALLERVRGYHWNPPRANASKSTLVDLLVARVVAEGHPEAFDQVSEIKRREKAARETAATKRDALAVLTLWADGVAVHDGTTGAAPADMVEAYKESLLQTGRAFKNAVESEGLNLTALRVLQDHLNGYQDNETRLWNLYQVRISDLSTLLAQISARQFALGVVHKALTGQGRVTMGLGYRDRQFRETVERMPLLKN